MSDFKVTDYVWIFFISMLITAMFYPAVSQP